MTREIPDNPPALIMAERPDWSLFRTFDGLSQRAGVPARQLRRLVLKELADNALDTNTEIDYGEIDDDRYFVEDRGPGLDGTPEQIAELYSMARPMRSTKLLRLPQRGALGNGLRVVAGAVFASEGSLTVITRNKRIELQPLADGTTKVVGVMPADRVVGTRIEISFGSTMPTMATLLDGLALRRILPSRATRQDRSPWAEAIDEGAIGDFRLPTGTTPRNSTSYCWRVARSRYALSSRSSMVAGAARPARSSTASGLGAPHARTSPAHKPSSCSRRRVSDPEGLLPIGWALSVAMPIPALLRR